MLCFVSALLCCCSYVGWPCQIYDPQFSPPNIQKQRPKGGDHVLVSYFDEDSPSFNWIRNSRAVLLHYRGSWYDKFKSIKRKGFDKAVQLADQHEKQWNTEHPQHAADIENDIYEQVKVKPQKSSTKQQKAKSTASPSKSKPSTASSSTTGKHTGTKRSAAEKDDSTRKTKKKRFSQTEVIQLLEDSQLDFTTQQIAFVLRLYTGDVIVGKTDRVQANDDEMTADESDELEALPRTKASKLAIANRTAHDASDDGTSIGE
jgi:hypothetical protein